MQEQASFQFHDDLPAIGEISAQMGLPAATVTRLLAMLPPKVTALVSEIRSALTEGDVTAAARGAHSIKGACGNMRLEPVYRLAVTLEERVKEEPRDEGAVAALCEEILGYAREMEKMLEAEM